MSITQPECVCVLVTLVIQHVTRTRHIVICNLSRSTIIFHVVSYTIGSSKEKKITEHTTCFLFSMQLLFETLLIIRRNERNITANVYIGLHVMYPLFVSDFNKSWIFSTYFRKILKPPNFITFVHLFHTEGRTDMTKLIVAFRHFANALKKKKFGASSTSVYSHRSLKSSNSQDVREKFRFTQRAITYSSVALQPIDVTQRQ
jgi:hypothetical protein